MLAIVKNKLFVSTCLVHELVYCNSHARGLKRISTSNVKEKQLLISYCIENTNIPKCVHMTTLSYYRRHSQLVLWLVAIMGPSLLHLYELKVVTISPCIIILLLYYTIRMGMHYTRSTELHTKTFRQWGWCNWWNRWLISEEKRFWNNLRTKQCMV